MRSIVHQVIIVHMSREKSEIWFLPLWSFWSNGKAGNIQMITKQMKNYNCKNIISMNY